jgi:type I restriction enzyme, S subunit
MVNNSFLWERLDSLCDIVISSVDKKSRDRETTVRLCNFTDVYRNWAIYKEDYDSFMIATASNKDIKRLSLKEGDVCITKDSETRDDIGMSTYIAAEFSNVVLGYHCALLRPNANGKIYGPYLKAYLASYLGRKYFSQQSSGSGQRYTLTIESIAAIKVPLVCMDKQKEIGDFLLNLDKQIHFNNLSSQTLEETAKNLYDYWFIQFDFPNKEGKPYRSSGGKMVWNEELKREIPEGWEVRTLGEYFNFIKGSIPEKLVDKPLNESYMPYLTIDAVNGGSYKYCPGINMPIADKHVLMVMDGAASSETYVGFYGVLGSTFAMLEIKNKNLSNGMLYYLMKRNEKTFKRVNTGSTVPHANKNYISNFKVAMPQDSILKRLGIALETITSMQMSCFNENKELSFLRDYLLPLLMNGQVTIGE